MADDELDGGQDCGLIAVVDQAGGGQIEVFGDGEVLVVWLAGGTLLVALVSGDLLGDTVAIREDFDLLGKVGESAFAVDGAAVENEYVHECS